MPAGSNGSHRPCPLCVIKGYESDHYPLSLRCGVKVLSSKEIIKTMDDAKVCPTCCCKHRSDYNCSTNYRNGDSRICSKKCSHNSHPLNHYACKHNDEAPTVSVSKVGSERSIPLVENLNLGHLFIGIQYDTGCQLSLISRSVLQTLPSSMYSQGNFTRVRVLSLRRGW